MANLSGLFKNINNLPPRVVNSGRVFMLRVFGMALSYAAIIYISNVYGAEAFGRYSLSVTLWQLLILIFSLGIPQAILKLTADTNSYDEAPQSNYLSKASKTLLVSASVCSLALFFLKEWLAISVFNDPNLIFYFKYISLFVILGIFHSFLTEFLRGKQDFIKYGLFVYVLPYLLLLAFMYLFKISGYPEHSTILSFLLAFGFLAIILLFYFPRSRAQKDYPYKKLFALSFPMLFSAAFMFISNWTDIFMLGAMVSKKDVGIYNAAYKLATIALIVINAVNTVLAPKISELYGKNQLRSIGKEVQRGTRLIVIFTVPIVVVLILFRKSLLGFFGGEFVDSGQEVLIVVSLGLLFNALSGSVGQVLNMTQHQKELRNFTIISAISNALLNYFLIKNFGIIGAAIASLMSNMLLNILCVIFVYKKYKILTIYRFWRIYGN
jgi:O-antigen/teichoic acid export membrane protein